jgi:hypothetical protein
VLLADVGVRGAELTEAAWLLPDFVSYLDAHGSRTVTIEAALQWGQQPENGWRRAWAHRG